ncbi:MAG: ParA family protein [Gammaproteobacteria bacterium]|nr:ParA family protein [Gammaproteobacteria bacterium]
MKIMATHNIKGGVGKTSAAVSLAYLAACDGYRTLLWDLDPQGAASFCFRIKPKVRGGVKSLKRDPFSLEQAVKATDFEGLDLIPADFSLRNFDRIFTRTKNPTRHLARLLTPLRQEYDLLFIDCAPSISLMAENIFHAADALLVPLIPSTFSVRTYHQMLDYFHKNPPKKLQLLPFFSMYDKRRQLQRDLVASMSDEVREMLNTSIPYAKNVELMGVERAPVNQFAPTSRSAVAYRNLWREVKVRALDDYTL